ncbi:hypothetical protein LA03_22340 [Burkholderia gladioli]|uniref:hypothetical protein n=1 Tax=Burkholderia gladioli TaxID=28095 RepID=UPI000315D3CA|nr:hypothetical protein [Burkholderia gladioli]KGE08247.1 hypothetical protein LA03_22340 [Burkholderia gladioli]MBW5288243.1 hypothetical protein [Burkholderia gladioli]
MGAGQIQATDANHQAQDVANLSRDTAGTNGAVSKLPDVNSTIAQQADLMNAVSAAGEAVATKIGDYADSKRDDAIKEAKAAQDRGDLDAMRGYLDEAKYWAEGGSNRTMLYVAGGGLIEGVWVVAVSAARCRAQRLDRPLIRLKNSQVNFPDSFHPGSYIYECECAPI